MKTCSNCGASLNDNASVCPNCGKSVANAYPTFYPATPKKPVSVGGWIGRSLIPFIPIVGGIVYLIMLFIWSGDTDKEETSRNWAKAQLIVMAIVLVLTIIVAVLFGAVIAEALSYM